MTFIMWLYSQIDIRQSLSGEAWLNYLTQDVWFKAPDFITTGKPRNFKNLYWAIWEY